MPAAPKPRRMPDAGSADRAAEGDVVQRALLLLFDASPLKNVILVEAVVAVNCTLNNSQFSMLVGAVGLVKLTRVAPPMLRSTVEGKNVLLSVVEPT